MLPGFDHITAPLSEKELNTLLPAFIKGLSKRVGKSSAITSTQIIKGFKEHKGINISGPTVRKLINYIRKNRKLRGIVATEKGYHITHDPQELIEYAKSVRGRINELLDIEKETLDYAKDRQQAIEQNLYQ